MASVAITAPANAGPRVKSGGNRAALNWIGLSLVWLFVIGLVLPVESSVMVGDLRLSPYRMVLILAALPVLYRFLTGQAHGMIWPDALMLAHTLWAVAALFVTHGDLAVEPAGIYALEAAIPYFLARTYIRSAADFEAFARVMAVLIALLIPWAAYESITHDILRNPPVVYPPRWGLMRAYGPFEHPILYGTFCAAMFGIIFFALKDRVSASSRIMRGGAVLAATFFSLSAGPLTALVAQIGLAGWNWVLKNVRYRWLILAGMFAGAWGIVSLLSTRTPIHVFIWYFTFDRGTSYMRILIWEYGSANVAAHPVFGLGMGDWARPEWMPPSVDNFWLVTAMRYGVPAVAFLLLAMLWMCFQVGRNKKLEDQHARNCRLGWMFSLIGLIVAGSTVHYWNATFCLFMFLLGAGAWMTRPAPATTRQAAAMTQHLPAYHKLMRDRTKTATAGAAAE